MLPDAEDRRGGTPVVRCGLCWEDGGQVPLNLSVVQELEADSTALVP